MNTSIDPSRIFTRQQVDDLLTAAINKTLLQVDKAQLFAHHDGRDKVKGRKGVWHLCALPLVRLSLRRCWAMWER